MLIGAHDTADRVLIVAEIGNNHEGDLAVAKQLIQHAAAAGADAVKFQTFRTAAFVSPRDATRFAHFKRFELQPAEFAELAGCAADAGVLFLSTPFDLESAAVLEPLVAAFKIASGDNTFLPLLQRVGQTGKPCLLSTGLANPDVIDQALTTLRSAGAGPLALLHCVSAYPTPPAEANLGAIRVLAERFGADVGYSDHTLGIAAATTAVAVGARIVEKHFTLDKQYSEFRDHALSADPVELAALVDAVRTTETLLGLGCKTVQPSERPGLTSMRRSICAARDLPAGHVVTTADLTWLRPGGGLPPGREAAVLGTTLTEPVAAGDPLRGVRSEHTSAATTVAPSKQPT